MRITIPHFYDFGQQGAELGDALNTPQAWDSLRTGSPGAFAMATDCDAWEQQSRQNSIVRTRAKDLCNELATLGARSLASYGVGGAILEYWVRELSPDLALTITENAPATLSRLELFFPEAAVALHDILNEDPVSADVHLLHRIDTEFSNDELSRIIARLQNETVIVIATRLLDLRAVLGELRQRLKPGATRAGLQRTRAVFEETWRDSHAIERHSFGDLEGWILTPKVRR